STGLSSTLDLIDLTDKGQACNFEQQEWQEIKSTLMTKYASNKKCHVPQAVATTWKIITSLAHICLILLLFFFTSLNIMEDNPRLLEKKYASRFTEYDYLGKVWSPLFDSILAMNGSTIRLKRFSSEA
ncbi:hypothetical protein BCV72DRAFT_319317, partial [Rhizopus microsporus var. microsporus]